jgi:hypothetical protein
MPNSQQRREAREALTESQQRLQNEECFDTFMENSLVLPLNEAFEAPIAQMFRAERSVLWIDQAAQQQLYSPSFRLPAGYTTTPASPHPTPPSYSSQFRQWA